MISTAKLIKRVALIIAILFCAPNTNAQLLKKLKKRAERTVERKIEQKVDRETSKGMDSILNPNDGSSRKDSPDSKPNESPSPTKGDNSKSETNNPNISDDLEIYSKFDFVPGDKQLFFDDFSQDFIGDFPSKWNTNGTGEVIKLNNVEGNWFEIKAGHYLYYIPLLDQELPEEYTVEFDLLTSGLDGQTSGTAGLEVLFDDNDGFRIGADMAQASLPLCQYIARGINIQNKKNNKREIYSNISADIRNDILNQPHISIAVNKKRFRLWVNQRKYIDVPQLVPENKLKFLKFGVNTLKDDKDRVFIRNLKIAEGGVDLRRKLMNEGRISTNGILFDSGSANIQPQSLGIVRQISQVLMQDENINLMIVGHTDSDGSDDINLQLSKSRAEAVKSALINIYKVSGDRLTTDGKGESSPVSDNSSTEGKSQNRRVEFIKQ